MKYVLITLMFLANFLDGCKCMRGNKFKYSSPTRPTSGFFAVGYSKVVNSDDTSVELPVLWKDGKIEVLPILDEEKGGEATAITIVDGDLYIAGTCRVEIKDGHDLNIPGYWKNSEWKSLPLTVANENGWATSIAVDKGNVYVAGHFFTGQEKRVSGYWKNGVWNQLASNDSAKWLTISGGSLYTAGNNSSVTMIPSGYWKDGAWTTIWQGRTGTEDESWVNALTVLNGDVYMAGKIKTETDFTKTESGFWINGIWTYLRDKDSSCTYCWASSIFVSQGRVLIGGQRQEARDLRFAGYFTGEKWVDLTKDLVDGKIDENVNAISVKGQDIYAAGYTRKRPTGPVADDYWINGTKVASYWKNSVLVTLPTLANDKDSAVNAIFIYDSKQ